MALRRPMSTQATHRLKCLPTLGPTAGWTPLQPPGVLHAREQPAGISTGGHACPAFLHRQPWLLPLHPCEKDGGVPVSAL